MLSPILSVHDIDASIEFYMKTLGFTHGFSMPGPDGKTSFASVKFGEAEVLLGTIDFVAAEDRHKLGTGIQLYVEVPEGIDAMYRQAKAAGANITREIEDRDWGERAFSVKDPDGYHYMFAQRVRSE